MSKKCKGNPLERYTFIGIGTADNNEIPSITIYGISGFKGLRIYKHSAAIRSLGNGILVNFKESDEKLFTKIGVKTISIQTILSIAGSCSYEMEDIDYIFKKAAGINYSHIFCKDRCIDFSILFQSKGFWKRIANLIHECMDSLVQQGLEEFFVLEVNVTPVLHRMFDTGYPVNGQGIFAEYENLRKSLKEIKQLLKDVYGVSPYISETQIKDGTLLEKLHYFHKIEDKLKRVPAEIVHGYSRKTVLLSCNFRSIGTDTFRIMTHHVNVQGLPKVFRNYLLPRHGDMILEYDLVSSQLIILACLADEKELISAYGHGSDLYLYIAAKILCRRQEKVSMEERNALKRMILQMLYGAGVQTIYKEISSAGYKISCSQIREMEKSFYLSFPNIKKYSEYVKSAEKIHLPTGRIWRLENSVEPYKRLAYILQYVESEILRRVLVLLDLKAKKNNFWIYLCIHDSVLIEISAQDYSNVKNVVQCCFDEAVQRCCPQLVKIMVKEEVIYGGFK